MRCEGKTVVVTGGGKGIGRAICLALAREGARLAVWDQDLALAQACAAEIELGGGQAWARAVDVSCKDQVQAAAREMLTSWGRLDVLINNAGICRVSSIEDIAEADWDRVLAVNLKGTFLCSQAVMAAMKAQRGGTIINLGSVAGKVGGIATGAHYSASKAAIICFTKSLARELAPFGVTANAIAPGIIASDMTQAITGGDWSNYLATIPLGRVGGVEEVARVAVFLASSDASFMTGEIMDVNGGQFMD